MTRGMPRVRRYLQSQWQGLQGVNFRLDPQLATLGKICPLLRGASQQLLNECREQLLECLVRVRASTPPWWKRRQHKTNPVWCGRLVVVAYPPT